MVLEGHTTDGRGFEDKLKNKEFSLREEVDYHNVGRFPQIILCIAKYLYITYYVH